MSETRTDIYTRITNRIVADLEQGVRPWHRPWNAEHAAGKITRPCGTTASPTKEDRRGVRRSIRARELQAGA